MVASSTAAAQTTERPYDVLISYAREDVERASALEALLSGLPHRLKVWRDKTNLLPGQQVDFAIPAALRDAKVVVVLWSPQSIGSDWVRHEAGYAVVEGKAATLAISPFDYGVLPSIYRGLHCGDCDDILADPAPLLKRLAELNNPAVRSRLRRIDISRMPTTYASRLFGREAEMADLNRAWDSAGADKTNVVVLDAMGGIGKTALVNHFVQGLAARAGAGPRRCSCGRSTARERTRNGKPRPTSSSRRRSPGSVTRARRPARRTRRACGSRS
jgi:hypothetical protein